MKELYYAIQVASRNGQNTFGTGFIVNVNETTAQVRLEGAQSPQECDRLDGLDLKRGDFAVLIRPSSNRRWVVLGTVSRPESGKSLTTLRPDQVILSPPNRIREELSIPGTLLVAWDVPYQQNLTFQIQVSPDGELVSQTLTTRGAYAIIATDTPQYIRVRSIATNNRFSHWSPWVVMQPAPDYEQSAMGGHIETAFDKNTPDDFTLWSPLANTLLRRIIVVIEEAFDGKQAVSIGGPGAKDLYLASTEMDASLVGAYSVEPRFTFFDQDDIRFFRSGPSSPTGSGRVFFYY